MFGDAVGIASFENEVSTFDVSEFAQAVDDRIPGSATRLSISSG